jgi:hypothetical protein
MSSTIEKLPKPNLSKGGNSKLKGAKVGWQ